MNMLLVEDNPCPIPRAAAKHKLIVTLELEQFNCALSSGALYQGHTNFTQKL